MDTDDGFYTHKRKLWGQAIFLPCQISPLQMLCEYLIIICGNKDHLPVKNLSRGRHQVLSHIKLYSLDGLFRLHKPIFHKHG